MSAQFATAEEEALYIYDTPVAPQAVAVWRSSAVAVLISALLAYRDQFTIESAQDHPDDVILVCAMLRDLGYEPLS